MRSTGKRPVQGASHNYTHLAAVSTLYILVAIQLEERDLVAALPGHAEYRGRVGMLLPRVAATSSVTALAGCSCH